MSVKIEQIELVRERFASILEVELIDEILNEANLVSISSDHLLIDIDERIEFLPLVISGTLKILTEDEEGRELLLYHLENGDTCAVTLNCCAKSTPSKVRAIAEQDVEVLLIPVGKFEPWLAKYSSWRSFILETYNYRMSEMLKAVDSLAFDNMEERVMKYLRNKAMVLGSTAIPITHLEIANDLHSSRVVISRVLKKLEIENIIVQRRNQLTLKKL